MSKNSVSVGGSLLQSAIVVGDQNKIRQSWQEPTSSPPDTGSEEIFRSLAELRGLVERLDTPDRAKIVRALEDAQEEAKKPTPDKEEVAGALQRVVKYAKAAQGVGEVVKELQDPLSIIAGWIGTATPIAARLFGLVP